MIKNNLLLALRILFKNRTYTLVNILGLSIGIATFLVIMRYVEYEFSFNRFFPDADRIYRLDYYEYQNNEPLRQTSRTHSRAALIIKDEMPEILQATRIYHENCLIFNDRAKITDQKVLWVDSCFFKVFRVKLLRGNPDEALVTPNSMVISESQARIYFGNDDPMGKTLYFNEHLPFTVTGVFEDIPKNSTLRFNFLNSWSTIENYGWSVRGGDFRYPWVFTFVFVNKEANDIDRINQKLRDFAHRHIVTGNQKLVTGNYKLRPLTELHFNTNLKEEMEAGKSRSLLYALISIAIFILITAWINYVNLSLAKSFERAGEIGVRKVYGAGTGQISGQYIIESLIIALFTFFIGYSIYEILAYLLSKLSSETFVMATGRGWIWLGYISVILLGTTLSSVYPARIMSRFKPALILKHKFTNRNNYLRNGLVVFQFILSTALIGCTLIAFRQISYIRNFDLGFNTVQTISLRGPASVNSDSLRHQRFHAFRDEVLATSAFVAGTSSMNIPGQEPRFHDENVRMPGIANEKKLSYSVSWIDEGYIETFALKLTAGRNFAPNETGDFCLINETAARELGFSNPADAVNTYFITDSARKEIILGVLRDFHHESIKKSLDPYLFYNIHPYEFGYYTFRLKKQGDREALSKLRSIWEKHYPNDPFIYYFMDDFFARQYESDDLFGKVLGLFSLLSVIIASLGLFGLASFSIVKRTKEIGVRKVNGARVIDLILLLIKDYTRLIVVAMVIAIPLIDVLMNKWLGSYVYRTRLTLWDMLLPLAIIFVIMLITLSYHVVRTTRTNPVEALKDE
ncbi:MAG TPA: ABC transporter permease [Bacteroidales bacterium]